VAASDFFSRWGAKKTQAAVAKPESEAPASPAATAPLAKTEPAPLPTLEDVQHLTPDADFQPFVSRQVTPEVRNAAMRKLFSDPHFNVMDRMDIYIDDYGQPDPLPVGMLQRCAARNSCSWCRQSKRKNPPQGRVGKMPIQPRHQTWHSPNPGMAKRHLPSPHP